METNHKNYESLLEAVDLFVEFINQLTKFVIDNELIKKIYLPTKILNLTKINQLAITIKMSEDDAFNILNAKNPNTALFDYFLKNNEEKLNKIINDSKHYPILQNKIAYYEDALAAYHNGTYYSACIALFSICDYLLTVTQHNNTTNVPARLQPIIKHLQYKETFSLFVCSSFQVMPTFFEYSKFGTETEPAFLNRHWILHGRSNRTVTQADCIKLFCLIHALLITDRLINEYNE